MMSYIDTLERKLDAALAELQKIRAERREARAELGEVRAQVQAQLAEILRRLDGAPPADECKRSGCTGALVCLLCAARMLNLKPNTLRLGRTGTHEIPRQSSHQLLYLRSDVERFIRDRAERVQAQSDRATRKLLRKRRWRA